jgi:hypothetical protein
MQLFNEFGPANLAPRAENAPGIRRSPLRPLDDPGGNACRDQQARCFRIDVIQKLLASFAMALGHLAILLAKLDPCVARAKSRKGA